MVREFTELQGTMGGLYARHEGLPEAVSKAIYFHYLPVGVEPNAPPTREPLGAGAVAWAAVSVADKLDSVVGLFAAGERPTGTRDPLAMRRQAQGLLRVLVDLPELTGLDVSVGARRRWSTRSRRASRPTPCAPRRRRGRPALRDARRRRRMARRADRVPGRAPALPVRAARLRRRRDQRGACRSGAPLEALAPLDLRRRLEALRGMRGSADFTALAAAFKRVKNIAKDTQPGR